MNQNIKIIVGDNPNTISASIPSDAMDDNPNILFETYQALLDTYRMDGLVAKLGHITAKMVNPSNE